MAEPKQKLSRSRSRKRKGVQIFKAPNLTECPKCKSKILPHYVCPTCGTYKGRQVLEVKTKITKRVKKKKREKKKVEQGDPPADETGISTSTGKEKKEGIKRFKDGK